MVPYYQKKKLRTAYVLRRARSTYLVLLHAYTDRPVCFWNALCVDDRRIFLGTTTLPCDHHVAPIRIHVRYSDNCVIRIPAYTRVTTVPVMQDRCKYTKTNAKIKWTLRRSGEDGKKVVIGTMHETTYESYLYPSRTRRKTFRALVVADLVNMQISEARTANLARTAFIRAIKPVERTCARGGTILPQ